MRNRVANRRGAPLRDTEQDERFLGLRRGDHRFEVLGGRVERQRADVAIAHAAAAFVVADEAIVSAEESNPVLPDRALGVVLEVRQPVRGLDDGRTAAGLRPCDRGAVGGLREVYRLTQWLDRFVRLPRV